MIARKQEGLEILYDNYSSALYGVIQRIVANDEIAEDVLQETFIKIWNNFPQYDKAKGRLFTWMINIARNSALDKVRSREFVSQRKNRELTNAVTMSEAGVFSYNPDTIGLREMVGRLEGEYRQVIELLFFAGLTQAEAAEKLNIPLGTVKTRSRAALQKLKSGFDVIRNK